MELRGSWPGFLVVLTLGAAGACGSSAESDAVPAADAAGGGAPSDVAPPAGAGAPTSDAAGASCTADREPLGSGTFDGDVMLGSAADVATVAGFAEIEGSLIILQAFSGALELPNLIRVGGDLRHEGGPVDRSGSPQVTRLLLPNLQRIDGKLWIYLARNLVELDLRALESIGGELFIMRNLALQSVRFDSLVEVGSVIFQAQTSLPACATDPFPVIDGEALANGGADMLCHCESRCGFPVARCDSL